MKQVNIRVSDEEYAILELIANRRGIPVTSMFKSVIYETFDTWKVEELLRLYAEGNISFKKILRLTGWTYGALLHKFAEMDLEPPIIEAAELRAEEIIDNINPSSVLKGKIPDNGPDV